MIIEMTGESGCGKSTIGNCFIKNTHGVRKRKSLSRNAVILALLHILLNRKCRTLYRKLIFLSLKVNGTKRIGKNAFYLIGLVYELYLSDKSDEEIVLIDQGIVQFLNSVYYHKAPDENDCASVVRLLLQWNVVIIFCQCPYELLVERIQGRAKKQGERSRRIENSGKEVFDLHEIFFDFIYGQIPENRRLRLDASAEIMENAHAITEFIGSRR